jgi:hypothetical protein
MNYTNEQQTIIHGEERITSIMGVPGCGKTTTLWGKIKYNRSNNIIITRTNSVVEEIRYHALKDNIIFNRINTSGHYIHKRDNGTYITITNIDAFIHYQLTKGNIPLNGKGDNFSYKKILLEKLIKDNVITELYIKNIENNSIRANQIYIDEVQDMIPIELSIFINILKNNPLIKCSVFGDTLQTLTEESTNEYPIIAFNKKLNAKQYNLSLCFRCPKAHTLFNNKILHETRSVGKYGDLPNIISNNENVLDKPYIFTHDGMNNNSNGYSIGTILINIIQTCMNYDDTLTFGDISILSNKINDCSSIPIILASLIREFGEHFHYFETNKSNTCIPIDFNKIKEIYCKCINKSNKNKKFLVNSNYCEKCNTHRKKNKACIISIDAFKGKESKLIICLNLADKSIPRENHIDKKEELTDFSKLNVLSTRSTKYLFLGINGSLPSRYFMNKYKRLESNNLIYHTWDLLNPNQTDLFKDAPDVYKKIAELDIMKSNMRPNTIEFPTRNTPNKTNIDVTDIASNIDIDTLVSYKIDEYEIYGKKCNFSQQYDSRILGNMGNIIMLRELYTNNKIQDDYSNQLEMLQQCDDNNILEITSDQIYSIIVDLCINNIIIRNIKKPTEELINIYHLLLESFLQNISKMKLNKQLKDIYKQKIGYLITSREVKLLCHSDYVSIFSNLKPFLNRTIQNENIDSNIFFNIAILNEHLTSSIFRPVNKNYIDIFKEDITMLHQNCNIVSRQLDSCHLEKMISFNYTERSEDIIKLLGYNILKKDDNNIFRDGYPCKLVGISDIIYHNNLIEIKTSHSDMCNKSWILQVLLYSIFNTINYNKNYDNIYINNILSGTKYKIIFDEFNIKEILIKILDKYKFIEPLKVQFITNILNK